MNAQDKYNLELPQDFVKWCHSSAFEHSYLFVTPYKKEYDIECRACGDWKTIDKKTYKVSHKGENHCPICGASVLTLYFSKVTNDIYDEKLVSLLQKVEASDGIIEIVQRTFLLSRQTNRNNGDAESVLFDLNEVERIIFDNKGGYTFSSYDFFANCKEEEWVKSEECHSLTYKNLQTTIYPGNLSYELTGTIYQYAAVQEFASFKFKLPLHKYLVKYLEKKQLEVLNKIGYKKLVSEITSGVDWAGNRSVLNDATSIHEILGLSKEFCRMLLIFDGGFDDIKLLRRAERLNCRFTVESYRDYKDVFGTSDFGLSLLDKTTQHKAIRYLRMQYESLGYKRMSDLVRDWDDYIHQSASLDRDVYNSFILFPKNLKEAHDRTYKDYKDYRENHDKAKLIVEQKMANVVIDSQRELVNKIAEKVNGDLLLVSPNDATDIQKEGEALRHCVGGYVRNVANGLTSIYFIRRAECPEVSFYTLQLTNGKVMQCRGFCNNAMTAEVERFVMKIEDELYNQVMKSELESQDDVILEQVA